MRKISFSFLSVYLLFKTLLILQMPLVMKEIEAKTEDPLEKATISKILQMKELSLSKFLP
jgi:hypothetical protein